MASNDVKLLSDMMARSFADASGAMDENVHHTYFTAKHYLREFQPTHDDLMAGIVDGERDGGVDGIYIFVDGYCVRDDAELTGLGRNAEVDLILIQTKNTAGFGESAVEKLALNLPIWLDFDRDEAHLSKSFNPKVIEITRRFIQTYRALEMPSLRVFVCFASLRAEHLHPSTAERAELLPAALKKCFGSCETEVAFLDAAQLADFARELPVAVRKLPLAESPMSTDVPGGYVGVVRLRDYQEFITDATGRLDATLFEANVRDYEGENDVNRSIRQTLEDVDPDIDFWWLNNGVTIVADRVQQSNKVLELRSPQIVNGLQTSHEIYKKSRESAGGKDDSRSVLVKVVEANDENTRIRIVRATNSQTTLGLSSLRATDKVQRQIEERLRAEGLYYERRRNLYGNRGLPLSKIISVDQMGQALLSTIAQAPHVARGEASRAFADGTYELLFNAGYDIGAYASAIRVLRECEGFLRSHSEARAQVADFVFHLTMLTTVALTRKLSPSDRDLASIELRASRDLHSHMLTIVREEFAAGARRRREVLFDRVAKDSEVTAALLERGRQFLAGTRRR